MTSQPPELKAVEKGFSSIHTRTEALAEPKNNWETGQARSIPEQRANKVSTIEHPRQNIGSYETTNIEEAGALGREIKI